MAISNIKQSRWTYRSYLACSSHGHVTGWLYGSVCSRRRDSATLEMFRVGSAEESRQVGYKVRLLSHGETEHSMSFDVELELIDSSELFDWVLLFCSIVQNVCGFLLVTKWLIGTVQLNLTGLVTIIKWLVFQLCRSIG